MNLSPEVAHLLREALKEAHRLTQQGGAWTAYGHLAETIENLLEPVEAAEAPAVPEGFVFVARWHHSGVNLAVMARLYGEDARCCHPGPAGGLPLIIRPVNC